MHNAQTVTLGRTQMGKKTFCSNLNNEQFDGKKRTYTFKIICFGAPKTLC
jgi:hypothetical protein